jgi:hypothetical protein
MDLFEMNNTTNAAPEPEPLTLEKLNKCIRDLRAQFPDEFKAIALREKYERWLFGPIPFKFPF